MPVTTRKLWAAYILGAAVLTTGVGSGLLHNRTAHKPPTPVASPQPTAIHPADSSPPAPIGGHNDHTTTRRCTAITAIDAHNASEAFIFAVGNAYSSTIAAHHCLPATVTAHSDATGRDYTMMCAPESAALRCSGGQHAWIVFTPQHT